MHKFKITATQAATNEWKKSNTDKVSMGVKVGTDSSGKQIGTVETTGAQLVKSFVWTVASTLGLNYDHEIEEATSKTMTGTTSYTMTEDLDIDVPAGHSVIVFGWIGVKANDVTITTWIDKDEDGFPEGTEESTGVIRNSTNNGVDLTEAISIVVP